MYMRTKRRTCTCTRTCTSIVYIHAHVLYMYLYIPETCIRTCLWRGVRDKQETVISLHRQWREVAVFVGNMSVQTTTDAPISDESLTRKASHPRGMHVLNVGRSSRDHRPTRVYVRASGNAPGVCYMYSRVTGARTTKSMLIIIKMDGEKQINL